MIIELSITFKGEIQGISGDGRLTAREFKSHDIKWIKKVLGNELFRIIVLWSFVLPGGVLHFPVINIFSGFQGKPPFFTDSVIFLRTGFIII